MHAESAYRIKAYKHTYTVSNVNQDWIFEFPALTSSTVTGGERLGGRSSSLEVSISLSSDRWPADPGEGDARILEESGVEPLARSRLWRWAWRSCGEQNRVISWDLWGCEEYYKIITILSYHERSRLQQFLFTLFSLPLPQYKSPWFLGENTFCSLH